jgi:hypothetical protein
MFHGFIMDATFFAIKKFGHTLHPVDYYNYTANLYLKSVIISKDYLKERTPLRQKKKVNPHQTSFCSV